MDHAKTTHWIYRMVGCSERRLAGPDFRDGLQFVSWCLDLEPSLHPCVRWRAGEGSKGSHTRGSAVIPLCLRPILSLVVVVQITVEIKFYAVVSSGKNCFTNPQLTGTFAAHVSFRGSSTTTTTLAVGMRLPGSTCGTIDLVMNLAFL